MFYPSKRRKPSFFFVGQLFIFSILTENNISRLSLKIEGHFFSVLMCRIVALSPLHTTKCAIFSFSFSVQLFSPQQPVSTLIKTTSADVWKCCKGAKQKLDICSKSSLEKKNKKQKQRKACLVCEAQSSVSVGVRFASFDMSQHITPTTQHTHTDRVGKQTTRAIHVMIQSMTKGVRLIVRCVSH